MRAETELRGRVDEKEKSDSDGAQDNILRAFVERSKEAEKRILREAARAALFGRIRTSVS